MKKGRIAFVIVIAVMVIASGWVLARGGVIPGNNNDSLQCSAHLVSYREFFKEGKFDDALPHWRWAFLNCPLASRDLYTDGPKILGVMISRAKDTGIRDQLIDTLMMVYDEEVLYFGQEGYVRGRQALDLITYRPEDSLKIYEYFRKSIELEGADSDPVILTSCISLCANLVKSGRFPADSLTNAFWKLNSIIDQKKMDSRNDSVQFNRWSGIDDTVNTIVESYASCGLLLNLYVRRFDKVPNDTTLLKRIAGVLDQKGCAASDLFYQVAEDFHRLESTGLSAYYMGRMYWEKGDYGNAESYFLESVPLLVEEAEKSRAYYFLAMINIGRKSYNAAKSYALKALAINPNDGKCYILIGDIYTAVAPGCGSDEINTLAAYWAAFDKYDKARQIDNTVAQDAAARIASCSKHFPTHDKLSSFEIKEGSNYAVGCWINEVTTVRSAN